MKTRILVLLLLITTGWAVGSTILYLRLKNNPRVIAVTTELNKETSAAIPMNDIERLTFFRQFLDRYFNYDSNSFWQSQTSLAYLMTPELRQQRLKEVDRLKDKVQQKNLSQQGSLVSLSQNQDGTYQAKINVQITEEGLRRNLFVTLKLALTQTERSIENPWALNVEKLIFEKSLPQTSEADLNISLQAPGSTVISIPCAVESIQNSNESLLRTRITTLNTSEVQVTALKASAQPLSLSVLCKDADFPLVIQLNTKNKDLYIAYSAASAKPRLKPATPAPVRQKDAYDKAIDEAMGIRSRH